MKAVISELLSPVFYAYSFVHHKLKATPLSSPSTRFKDASRHLYNQLTELLIEKCPLVSLDIGGTLIKVTVFVPDSFQKIISIQQEFAKYYMPELSFRTQFTNGTYLFFRFHVTCIHKVIKFLNVNQFPFDKKRILRCTGGGAYKFKDELLSKTNFTSIEIHDEIASLRSGMLFLTALKIKNELGKLPQNQDQIDTAEPTDECPYENIQFDLDQIKKKPHARNPYPRNWVYPNLLVQVGSGVSFVKIDAEDYQRLEGSAIGGATFIGLALMLLNNLKTTQIDTKMFNQLQEMIRVGDAIKNTLTVGDIYGKAYGSLDADLPAAFFGKTNQDTNSLISALHQMICINIGQISVLVAKLHGLKRIVFSGGFITHEAQKQLDFAVKVYSQGQMECIFLWHDAVLGAIGAMLGKELEYSQSQDKIGKKIEQIVYDLEEVSESSVGVPKLVWESGVE